MATTKQDPQSPEAWGKRITKLADAAGLDIPTVAKRMEVHRSAVHHWFRGNRIPSRGMQADLAKCFGVSVAVLNGFAA